LGEEYEELILCKNALIVRKTIQNTLILQWILEEGGRGITIKISGVVICNSF
jgi:hypothetical protein